MFEKSVSEVVDNARARLPEVATSIFRTIKHFVVIQHVPERELVEETIYLAEGSEQLVIPAYAPIPPYARQETVIH